MSKVKQIQTLAIGLLLGGLIACGSKKQDPLEESKYQPLKQAKPLENRARPNQSGVFELFKVTCLEPNTTSACDTEFILGVEKSIQFQVHLYFSGSDAVNYELQFKNDKLVELGAKFSRSKEKPDIWVLSWLPRPDLLSSNIESKKFDLDFHFILKPNNTQNILSQFAGIDQSAEGRMHKQSIYVRKNDSRPVIKDFKISPANKLNPDQMATIYFTVVARDYDHKESIYVNLKPGPDQPSNELVQMNALVGHRKNLKLVKSSEKDKEGNTLFVYEMQFDTRAFADYALNKISESQNLRDKLNQGKLTSAEAKFEVEATNDYNGRRSVSVPIVFEVNLIDKPGRVILAGADQVQIKAGGEYSEKFFMRSSDSRSPVKVEDISVAGQVAQLKNSKANLSIEDVQIELECRNGKSELNEHFNCKSGDCYQVCILRAQSSCDANAKRLPVLVNASASLRGLVEKSQLTIQMNLAGKSALCDKKTQVAMVRGTPQPDAPKASAKATAKTNGKATSAPATTTTYVGEM